MSLRLANTSGKAGKEQEENETGNLTTDFCKRTFQLLASCYHLEGPPPLRFASATTGKKRLPEKGPAFQSKIVDLRMRRNQEQLETARNQKLKVLDGNLDEISRRLSEKSENIDEAFLNEKAPKPDIPAYIRNAEKYERKVELDTERAKCVPYKPMNMLEVEKLFTYRLAKAKESGEQRAKERVLRMRMHASQCNLSPYSKVEATRAPVINSAIQSPA